MVIFIIGVLAWILSGAIGLLLIIFNDYPELQTDYLNNIIPFWCSFLIGPTTLFFGIVMFSSDTFKPWLKKKIKNWAEKL